MRDPFFFGYGSLVNRATHGYAGALPARARHWRRAWLDLPERDVAILSAIPAPGAEITGLIAPVPGADWAALDLREAAYARRPLDEIAHEAGPADISIYAVEDHAHGTEAPILLSYLDVVIQGYLREFGPEGVAAFLDTTDGWNRPVQDDRASPIYPRAQRLTPEERRAVDRLLARATSAA